MYNEEFIFYNTMPYHSNSLNNSQMNNNKNNYMDYDSSKKSSLYNPYEGLIRGNMFKNLYNPYFKEEPFSLNPRNNQERELYNLMAYGFATTDLNLYLDTHPNDREAISLFNKYNDEHNRLVSEYERKYGPLELSSKALNTYPWSWNKSAWPWEENK